MRNRNTEQRRVIVEELMGLTSHPTASELHELVRRRLPRISLGTVYRNLEILCRSGAVCKLVAAGGEARYDGDGSAHRHVTCSSCGRVDDIVAAPGGEPEEVEPWRAAAGEVRSRNGFLVFERRVEYTGLCPECREARPREDTAPAPAAGREVGRSASERDPPGSEAV